MTAIHFSVIFEPFASSQYRKYVKLRNSTNFGVLFLILKSVFQIF